MRHRKKKNILIAILFCTLVFMGIGYASRNQILNITHTASISGNFDVHFKSVELLEYESYVDSGNKALMANGYGIGPTNTEAYMSAILKAPTEYVTFKAVIKNYGNIDAKITNIDIVPTADEDLRAFLTSKGKTLNNIGDYFEIEQVTGYELAPNTLIPAGEENELKIKVSFNSNATEIPDGALQVKLRLTYTQANGTGTSQTIPENPHENESRWQVDRYGTVIAYDKADLVNGYLTVPATDRNGNPIVSTSLGSFIDDYNIEGYATKKFVDVLFGNISSEDVVDDEYLNIAGIVIHDTENYDELLELATEKNFPVYDSIDEIPLLDSDEFFYFKITADPSDPETLGEDLLINTMVNSNKNITTVDLSKATNLKTTGIATFLGSSISRLIINDALEEIGPISFLYNNISEIETVGNSQLRVISPGAFTANSFESFDMSIGNLEEIGASVFDGNMISGTLVVPSNIKKIGNNAFYANKIDALDLSNATNLEYLSGFGSNKITSLNISSLPNLTTIGSRAFENNNISSLVIPSNIEIIDSNAFYSCHISSLDLTGATNLKKIGNSSFYNDNISILDLLNVTKLTEIGKQAFYDNDISTLDLSNANDLFRIGEEAFYSNQINGSIVINSKVEEISRSAFSSNNITNVDLSNATSLKVIGDNAFRNNKLTNIDFSNCHDLASVGAFVFGSNNRNIASVNVSYWNKDLFNSMPGVSSLWYYNNYIINLSGGANRPYDANSFNIIYKDVTCDAQNENCVANS